MNSDSLNMVSRLGEVPGTFFLSEPQLKTTVILDASIKKNTIKSYCIYYHEDKNCHFILDQIESNLSFSGQKVSAQRSSTKFFYSCPTFSYEAYRIRYVSASLFTFIIFQDKQFTLYDGKFLDIETNQVSYILIAIVLIWFPSKKVQKKLQHFQMKQVIL